MRKITGMIALAVLAIAMPAARLAQAADDAPAAPWLGVYTQTVDDALREAMELSGEGALVSRVVEGSPAARAGVEKGDIITRFASKPVGSSDELVRLVHDARPGQNVTLEVRRGDDSRTFTAQLATRPSDLGAPQPEPARRVVIRERGRDGKRVMESEDGDDTPEVRRVIVREKRGDAPPEKKHVRIIRRGTGTGDLDIEIPDLSELKELKGLRDGGRMRTFHFDGTPAPGMPGGPMDLMWMGLGRGRLGVQVQDLNAQLGEYFEVPGGRGALVMEVKKDTPAERVGLKAGDVITRVGGTTIESAADLIEALQGKKGKVQVAALRKGKTFSFEPELEPVTPRPTWTEAGDDHLAPEPPQRGDGDLGDVRDQLREMRQELQRLRSELESSRRK